MAVRGYDLAPDDLVLKVENKTGSLEEKKTYRKAKPSNITMCLNKWSDQSFTRNCSYLM